MRRWLQKDEALWKQRLSWRSPKTNIIHRHLLGAASAGASRWKSEPLPLSRQQGYAVAVSCDRCSAIVIVCCWSFSRPEKSLQPCTVLFVEEVFAIEKFGKESKPLDVEETPKRECRAFARGVGEGVVLRTTQPCGNCCDDYVRKFKLARKTFTKHSIVSAVVKHRVSKNLQLNTLNWTFSGKVNATS